MKFSKREIKDLWLAGVMISLAFAILFAGGYRIFLSLNPGLIELFVVAFFTAGIGFLLHELMHKFVAQRYGLWAEFHAFYNMLWLALLFSLFGFIFAAPGAVFIQGRMTAKQNGKISLAGPVMNIVLGILFLLGIFIAGKQGFVGAFIQTGLSINALLAAFNMIPIMPFDGAKVLAWSKGIYSVTTAVAVGLFILSLFV